MLCRNRYKEEPIIKLYSSHFAKNVVKTVGKKNRPYIRDRISLVYTRLMACGTLTQLGRCKGLKCKLFAFWDTVVLYNFQKNIVSYQRLADLGDIIKRQYPETEYSSLYDWTTEDSLAEFLENNISEKTVWLIVFVQLYKIPKFVEKIKRKKMRMNNWELVNDEMELLMKTQKMTDNLENIGKITKLSDGTTIDEWITGYLEDPCSNAQPRLKYVYKKIGYISMNMLERQITQDPFAPDELRKLYCEKFAVKPKGGREIYESDHNMHLYMKQLLLLDARDKLIDFVKVSKTIAYAQPYFDKKSPKRYMINTIHDYARLLSTKKKMPKGAVEFLKKITEDQKPVRK